MDKLTKPNINDTIKKLLQANTSLQNKHEASLSFFKWLLMAIYKAYICTLICTLKYVESVIIRGIRDGGYWGALISDEEAFERFINNTIGE